MQAVCLYQHADDSRRQSSSGKAYYEGGIGILGFAVLAICFRSVLRFLCHKTPVFRFWCSLRFADFLFFSIWFSVFVIDTSGFSVLVSDVGFSYFVLFGRRFLFDLNNN